MPNVELHPGITLFEAYRIAKEAGMYLVTNGEDTCISPMILPGWREVPIVVKIAAPTRGCVCTGEQVAA